MSSGKKSREGKDSKKQKKNLNRLSEASCWKSENFEKALDRIKRETTDLEKRPEVTGIGFGPKGRKGIEIDIPVIKIYTKWMSEKEAKKLKLPSEIAGYEVVVTPTQFCPTGCPNMDNNWYGQIRPGNNIGDRNSCATLGMKLWDRFWVGDPTQGLETQNEYFLTAYHSLPWIGTDVFQPGNPQVEDRRDIVGTVVKTISPDESDGQFEVSLIKIIKSNKSRILLQEPHAPAYPYQPNVEDKLHVMGAGDMRLDDTVTHYGWGYYDEYLRWADIYFTPGINKATRMYDQMLVLPSNSIYTSEEVLGTAGGSGAVFYDNHDIPVSIQVGMAKFGTYTGAVCSFLNRVNGPDVLDKLGVSNVPPDLETEPTTW